MKKKGQTAGCAARALPCADDDAAAVGRVVAWIVLRSNVGSGTAGGVVGSGAKLEDANLRLNDRHRHLTRLQALEVQLRRENQYPVDKCETLLHDICIALKDQGWKIEVIRSDRSDAPGMVTATYLRVFKDL